MISGDLWAGAEAQAAALLDRLAREPGVAVHAALMNRGELEQRLRRSGVDVSVLDETRLTPLRILAGLRTLVRGFDPQVVHTHRFKENILGGLAARLEGRRPSLRTVHGAPESRQPFWRVDKRLLEQADRFVERHWQQSTVAVSGDLLRRLVPSAPSIRHELIYNGLDEAAFDELKALHAGQPPARLVSFVGRLVPVKRVDLFLEMASQLLGRDPGGWTFQVIGDGPLRGPLQEQAASLGLGDAVRFLGFRQDANDLVARSGLLVFTSDHEGTPMAALEALAMGVPVVARAVGGLVEMLDGATGCRLVEGGDPQALSEAVRQAMNDPDRRRVRLPPRYHIDACAGAYLALYRALAAGGPVTRPSC